MTDTPPPTDPSATAAADPDAAASESDVTGSTAQSDAAESDASESDTTESGATESDTTESGATESDTSESDSVTGRGSRAPWLTAAVAGAALVALVVVYFVVLRPAKADAKPDAIEPGALTTTEQQAVAAAGTETANLLTFRRAHFDSDFARALAGTTGALRSDVEKEKSNTLSQMQKGKFDLGATVTNTALEGPTDSGGGYLVLVTVNAYRSTSQDQPLEQNLEVTVQRVKGMWLASDVESIEVQ